MKIKILKNLRDSIKKQISVPSQRDARKKYKVTIYKTGRVVCGCLGFRFHQPNPCFHISKYVLKTV